MVAALDVRPKLQHQETPKLEAGDRLTRTEFERRYLTMPGKSKAELIEGIVYMPSPVHHRRHSQPHSYITGCLFVYMSATPGTDIGDNATVRLDLDNEVQPDTLLRLTSEVGGSSVITDDDYIEGAPELAIEIAGSSVSYDMHAKLNVYRRNGVQEYLVWRVDEQAIDWFSLDAGNYVQLPVAADGLVRSRVFPGLWLNLAALLAHDLSSVLADLQRGIQSEEHAQFLDKLAIRSSRSTA